MVEMMVTGIVIGTIVLVILLIVIGDYNSFVHLRNKVKQSKSGIDVYLNQRFDLIPNLVECVKGYAKHEKEMFEKVTELRTQYAKTKDVKDAEKVNNQMNSILAVAENYPDLKASEQFLNLQKSLEKMESQLQAARRIYNIDVTNYNTCITSVPKNIIAGLFGFKEEKLFEIEEYKRENIKLDFGE